MLANYNKMLTEYEENNQMHVEQIQEHHFLRIKTNKAKNIAVGGGGSASIKYAAKAPSIHTKLQPLAFGLPPLIN